MIKNITVAILEPDQFFVQGVQHILLLYFHVQGVTPRFVGESEVMRADLVLLPKYKSLPLMLCLDHSPEALSVPAYITISNSHSGRQRDAPCHLVLGCIERRACPQVLLRQVEQIMRARKHRERTPAETCPQCMAQVLTGRERDVMCGMAWGISQACLSQYLHISPKTISTHKRAAMRKLGFRRNVELYHWLRLGGLKQIERS